MKAVNKTTQTTDYVYTIIDGKVMLAQMVITTVAEEAEV